MAKIEVNSEVAEELKRLSDLNNIPQTNEFQKVFLLFKPEETDLYFEIQVNDGWTCGCTIESLSDPICEKIWAFAKTLLN